MLEKIRRALNKKNCIPLTYTEELRSAYIGSSVTGGSLRGKKVLITGATGGIGMALCLRFLAEGSHIVLAARNMQKINDSIAYLKKRYPEGKIDFIILDLESDSTIRNAVDILKEKNFFPNILVNNAGVFTDVDRSRMFKTISKDDFLYTWNINFKAVYSFTKIIVEEMDLNNTEGVIVNVSSICAEQRSFQYTPYGMSKSAVSMMTEVLQERYNMLTVICIKPGSVATGMGNLKLGDNIASKCNILNRPALPEEIAACIAFMCGRVGKKLKKATVEAAACEVL